MKFRVALAAFTALLVIIVLAFAAAWILDDVRIVKDREFNEIIKAGIQLKVEQSRSEFQLCLLVMGALWTLIAAKKGEGGLVLSDLPELIMFICANVLLLLSCVYHILYVNDIASIYSIAGGFKDAKTIPDILGSGLDSPYRLQFWSLIGGVVAAATALFSAHKLK